MTKLQHETLLVLLLSIYTILGSVPSFHIAFNYVTWFGIIYLIASYIRLYPNPILDRRCLWGWLTFLSVSLSIISVFAFKFILSCSDFMVGDSNKIFAVTTAVSSFLWFKNMNIKYSKLINAIGASTFAVLLIHSNSEAMRTWLWKHFVNCVGHYDLPLVQLMAYTIGVAIAIFAVCVIIDRIRIKTLEDPFFRWYDHKFISKS